MTERANTVLEPSHLAGEGSTVDQAGHERESSATHRGRPGTMRSDDEHLFRDLMDRFTILAETCSRFSQDIYRRSGAMPDADIETTVRRNLKIARTIFGRWSLDILAVAHLTKSITFSELRGSLGRIGTPLLRSKLRQLEKMGLITRDAVGKRPADSRYSLTHKGLMIARLGEPVFLYLRLASGWRDTSANGPETREVDGSSTARTANEA